MNRLAFTRCYLAGPMDRVPDAGVKWRRQIRKTHNDLKIMWLDPTNKPIDIGIEDDESRARRRQAKACGEYDLVVKEINPIRRVDLRMVDISDWLIVHIDIDVHACGIWRRCFWLIGKRYRSLSTWSKGKVAPRTGFSPQSRIN